MAKINLPLDDSSSASIELREDSYYLTNGNSSNVEYIISTEKCSSSSRYLTGNLEKNQEVLLDLVEGNNTISLINSIGTVIGTFYVKNYIQLENNIIEGVFSILCGCECGCKDCIETTKNVFCETLSLRAKIDLYKNLTNPQGRGHFDSTYKYLECLAQDTVYCNITEENILGEATCNEKLIKQLIALDYLAMYFFSLSQENQEDNIVFIKNKYKIKKIFCCIQKLGIDIGEVEDIINNNMGQINFNSAGYINLPPSQVGDYSLNVTNRSTTVITLAMLTTLTTPVYVDPEGDAVQDVRIDSISLDGILTLSGVGVSVGDIITVADINAGNLIYGSPNQDAGDTDNFTFSLRDTGSGLFSN